MPPKKRGSTLTRRSVQELRETLTELGLDTTGSKAELVARIKKHREQPSETAPKQPEKVPDAAKEGNNYEDDSWKLPEDSEEEGANRDEAKADVLKDEAVDETGAQQDVKDAAHQAEEIGNDEGMDEPQEGEGKDTAVDETLEDDSKEEVDAEETEAQEQQDEAQNEVTGEMEQGDDDKELDDKNEEEEPKDSIVEETHEYEVVQIDEENQEGAASDETVGKAGDDCTVVDDEDCMIVEDEEEGAKSKDEKVVEAAVAKDVRSKDEKVVAKDVRSKDKKVVEAAGEKDVVSKDKTAGDAAEHDADVEVVDMEIEEDGKEEGKSEIEAKDGPKESNEAKEKRVYKRSTGGRSIPTMANKAEVAGGVKKKWLHTVAGKKMDVFRHLLCMKTLTLTSQKREHNKLGSPLTIQARPLTLDEVDSPVIRECMKMSKGSMIRFSPALDEQYENIQLGTLTLHFKTSTEMKACAAILQEEMPNLKLYSSFLKNSDQFYSDHLHLTTKTPPNTTTTASTVVVPSLPDDIDNDKLWEIFPTAWSITYVPPSEAVDTPPKQMMRQPGHAFIYYPNRGCLNRANQQAQRMPRPSELGDITLIPLERAAKLQPKDAPKQGAKGPHTGSANSGPNKGAASKGGPNKQQAGNWQQQQKYQNPKQKVESWKHQNVNKIQEQIWKEAQKQLSNRAVQVPKKRDRESIVQPQHAVRGYPLQARVPDYPSVKPLMKTPEVKAPPNDREKGLQVLSELMSSLEGLPQGAVTPANALEQLIRLQERETAASTQAYRDPLVSPQTFQDTPRAAQSFQEPAGSLRGYQEPTLHSYREAQAHPKSFGKPEAMQHSFHKLEPVLPSFPDAEASLKSFGEPEASRQNFRTQEQLRQSLHEPEPLRKSYGEPEPLRKSYGEPEPLRKSYGEPDPLRKSYGEPDPLQKSYGEPEPLQKSYGESDALRKSLGYREPEALQQSSYQDTLTPAPPGFPDLPPPPPTHTADDPYMDRNRQRSPKRSRSPAVHDLAPKRFRGDGYGDQASYLDDQPAALGPRPSIGQVMAHALKTQKGRQDDGPSSQGIKDRHGNIRHSITESQDIGMQERHGNIHHSMTENLDIGIQERHGNIRQGMTENLDIGIKDRHGNIRHSMTESQNIDIQEGHGNVRHSLTESQDIGIKDRHGNIRHNLTESQDIGIQDRHGNIRHNLMESQDIQPQSTADRFEDGQQRFEESRGSRNRPRRDDDRDRDRHSNDSRSNSRYGNESRGNGRYGDDSRGVRRYDNDRDDNRRPRNDRRDNRRPRNDDRGNSRQSNEDRRRNDDRGNSRQSTDDRRRNDDRSNSRQSNDDRRRNDDRSNSRHSNEDRQRNDNSGQSMFDSRGSGIHDDLSNRRQSDVAHGNSHTSMFDSRAGSGPSVQKSPVIAPPPKPAEKPAPPEPFNHLDVVSRILEASKNLHKNMNK